MDDTGMESKYIKWLEKNYWNEVEAIILLVNFCLEVENIG
jgi:hypothetical protein